MSGDELKQYYEYLKKEGADVPPSYESFERTLKNPESSKKYYQYLSDNKYDVAPTYESFSSTFKLNGNGQVTTTTEEVVPQAQTETKPETKNLAGTNIPISAIQQADKTQKTPENIADIAVGKTLAGAGTTYNEEWKKQQHSELDTRISDLQKDIDAGADSGVIIGGQTVFSKQKELENLQKKKLAMDAGAFTDQEKELFKTNNTLGEVNQEMNLVWQLRKYDNPNDYKSHVAYQFENYELPKTLSLGDKAEEQFHLLKNYNQASNELELLQKNASKLNAEQKTRYKELKTQVPELEKEYQGFVDTQFKETSDKIAAYTKEINSEKKKFDTYKNLNDQEMQKPDYMRNMNYQTAMQQSQAKIAGLSGEIARQQEKMKPFFQTDKEKTDEILRTQGNEMASFLSNLPKDLPPDQKMAALLSAKIEMFNELKTEWEANHDTKVEQFLSTSRGAFGAPDAKMAKMAKLNTDIEQLLPIVLLNKNPLSKKGEGFGDTFIKSATQTLNPSAIILGATEAQKNQSIAEALDVLGDGGITPGIKEGIVAKAQPENYSTQDWAQMLGTTTAFGLQFAAGTETVNAALKGYDFWKKLSASESILGKMLKTGIEYSGTGTLLNTQGEGTLASGSLGSLGSQGTEALLNGATKLLFGSKAAAAENLLMKILSPAATLTGRGLAEVPEEFIQQLVQIHQTTDGYQQSMAEFERQFGKRSQNFHFFVSTFVMGAGFGVGNIIGNKTNKAAQEAYSTLSSEEKKLADDIIEEANTDVKEAEKPIVKETTATEEKVAEEAPIEEIKPTEDGSSNEEAGVEEITPKEVEVVADAGEGTGEPVVADEIVDKGVGEGVEPVKEEEKAQEPVKEEPKTFETIKSETSKKIEQGTEEEAWQFLRDEGVINTPFNSNLGEHYSGLAKEYIASKGFESKKKSELEEAATVKNNLTVEENAIETPTIEEEVKPEETPVAEKELTTEEKIKQQKDIIAEQSKKLREPGKSKSEQKQIRKNIAQANKAIASLKKHGEIVLEGKKEKGVQYPKAHELQPTTAAGAIRQFFLRGGTMTRKAYEDLTGFGKMDEKSGKIRGLEEFRKSFMLRNEKEGIGYDDLARKLMTDPNLKHLFTGKSEQDVINEIQSVLRNFNGKADMHGKFLEEMESKGEPGEIEYEESALSEKEKQDFEEKNNASEETLASMSERELNVFQKIIDKYSDENGVVNYEAINDNAESDELLQSLYTGYIKNFKNLVDEKYSNSKPTTKTQSESNENSANKVADKGDRGTKEKPEKVKPKSISESAKKLADKIREGKVKRPGIFSAQTPASIVWDSALEAAALAVEAGGKLADAINAGLKAIRESEWYKSLSKEDKQEAVAAFEDHMNEKKAKESDEEIPIGVTNAATNAILAAQGEDPISKEARKYNQETWDNVINRIQSGKIDPKQAVLDIADSDHPTITDEEQAVILYDRVRITNEMELLDKMIGEANEIWNEKVRKQKLIELYQQRAQVEIELGLNITANTKAGTEWGRMGQFRQRLAKRDLSLASMLQQNKNIGLGKENSDDKIRIYEEIAKQNVRLQEQLTKEIAKHEKQLEEIEKERASEREKLGKEYLDRIKEEIAEALKNTTPAKETKATKKAVLNEEEIARKNELRKKYLGTLNDITRVLTMLAEKDFREYAGLVLKEAAGDFKAFSKELIETVGKEIKQYISGLYKELGGTGETEKAPKTFEELVAEVNDKSIGKLDESLRGTIDKMVRNRVENEIEDINAVVDSIYDAISPSMPSLTKTDLRDFITEYGKFRKLSKDEIDAKIRELKRQGKADASLEAVERGELPLRSGTERDKPTQETRQKRARILQIIKEKGIKPTLTEAEIDEQWRSAEKAYHTKLENAIADTQKEIDTRTKRKRTEGKKYNDERSKQLREDLERLKKIRDSILGKPDRTLTEAERIERMTDATEKAIADIQLGIDNIKAGKTESGEIFPEKNAPLPKVTSARLTELRNLKNALLEERQKLIPKEIRDSAAIEKYKKNRERRLAALEEQLKTGVFGKKQAAELPEMPPEVVEIQRQIRALEDRKELELERTRIANRGAWEKFGDGILDLLTLPKALRASVDLSAPLRQGITFIHKRAFWNAFVKMLKFAFSKKAFDSYMDNIRTHPDYHVMKNNKLFISEPNAKQRAKEELLQSRFIKFLDKIPILGTHLFAGSQRAYEGFLNVLRIQLYLDFKEDLKEYGLSNEEKTEELKAYSKFVNNGAGRGNVNAGKNGNIALNIIFFSPKFFVSRFNLLNPFFYKTLTPIARKEALKSMAASYGTLITTLILMGLLTDDDDWFDVEIDPRSSDFLKMKMGNIRLDVLTGFQQILRVAAQMSTGDKKNIGTGEIEDLDSDKFGATNRLDVGMQYFFNKLSPTGALVKSSLSGWKDNTGQEMDLGDVFGSLGVPLYLDQPIREMAQEEGWSATTVAMLLSLLGVGSNYYDPNKEAQPKLKKKKQPELKKEPKLKEKK